MKDIDKTYANTLSKSMIQIPIQVNAFAEVVKCIVLLMVVVLMTMVWYRGMDLGINPSMMCFPPSSPE